MTETGKSLNSLAVHLEALYRRFNRKEYVHPDPLEFLYPYSDPLDREIVGLVASSLAYGRVEQILVSTAKILDRMGPSPYRFLQDRTEADLAHSVSGFVHRFATDNHMTALLSGMKKLIHAYGSLQNCFLEHYHPSHENLIPAMDGFVRRLVSGQTPGPGHLIPVPGKGSACKRLNLFLRWMIRKDDVDPGGWDQIPASKLIIPLDVHMHRLARWLKFTHRKQANLKTALEITRQFAQFRPDDPVRYDFALSRLGIRRELDPMVWFQSVCP